MDLKRVGRITLTTFEWIAVVVFGLILVVILGLWVLLGWVGADPDPMGDASPAAVGGGPVLVAVAAAPPAPTPAEASSLFAPIHQVLTSPRCMNCHPGGDRPLARTGGAHAMNVSRASASNGLPCSTCHAEHNSKVFGGPPGAPHWGLPPADTPMIFEGRSVTALCVQLRDPKHNGQRSLAALHEHVAKDPLVLWGWDPGGDRTPPPIGHAEFEAAFKAWVDAGGICPGESAPPVLALDAPAGAAAAAH